MLTSFSMDGLSSKSILAAGLLTLSAGLLLSRRHHRPLHSNPKSIPSPLSNLTPETAATVPYPPTALPGPRHIPTPYGALHLFEFGPATGERVLLLPGLSTPCIALSSLAHHLAAHGYRVMLFDYFGRGWSDTPDPEEVDHDERLYISQILWALASSEVCWLCEEGFHIMGYSFGGGLAVSFASWFGHALRSVTLIAPGGLVRKANNSWRTALLYSRGIFPERLLQYLVRRRWEPVKVPKQELVEQAELGRKEASEDPFDGAILAPGVTVADVMAWQLGHHRGFIPAVMSCMRYGPIHERYEEWGRLGAMLVERRKDAALPGLLGGKVLLVLGNDDSIVKKEIIVPDVQRALGAEEAVEVVVLDAGHEVGITMGTEVAEAAMEFWNRNGHI